MLECLLFYIIRGNNQPLFTLELRFISLMLYKLPHEIEILFKNYYE